MLAPSETLVVRAAMSDQDAIEIHKLLMLMGQEIADAPVDPIVVMEDVYSFIASETKGAFLMATLGGKLIGCLGLENVRYRYSRETCISEVYLFVHPDHRKSGAFEALIAEATAIADMAGKKLYIRIANPNRRRGKREKVFDLLRYQPVGSIYAMHPRN
jgi:GNAT superfamily N-acetyltransferase